MGWETRKGRRYYYRKQRIGGRTVSVYCGSGTRGEVAAQEDAARRAAEAEAARQAGELSAPVNAATPVPVEPSSVAQPQPKPARLAYDAAREAEEERIAREEFERGHYLYRGHSRRW